MQSKTKPLSILKAPATLRGTIALPGSKSISNRALLLLKLAGVNPVNWIKNLSPADDTRILLRMLNHKGDLFNAGDGGTTFRFLAAWLALTKDETILTGSEGLRKRPVGALVRALRELGAYVEYLDKEGYPPLGINATRQLGLLQRRIRIPANISSQFLSALLMIGPCLPEGLELVPEGELVSRPYLEMTLRMMRDFGAQVAWEGEAIVVKPGFYEERPLHVEADWSAASYWYALAALSKDVDLHLLGLRADSLQGDSVLADMMQQFGIQTTYTDEGAHLQRSGVTLPARFAWDFVECPDVAQTLATLCAALGVPAVFSGLQTLRIKETDRIAALQNELAKTGVSFAEMPGQKPEHAKYELSGKAAWGAPPQFASYGDHRMAMAFAPLGLLGPLKIEAPEVVRKSYPDFWEHLQSVGFKLDGVPPPEVDEEEDWIDEEESLSPEKPR